MAISFVGLATSVSTSGATSLTINRPSGVSSGDLVVVALGFESQAAGSGPWVDPSGATSGGIIAGPVSGWRQICYQAPSASGNALEVWAAIHASGTLAEFDFTASYAALALSAAWRGVYEPHTTILDGAIRGATTGQNTGDNPEAPSIYAFVNEWTIAIGCHQLQSPGFGTPTPSGWTKRDDQKRSSFGNIEITIADKPVTVEGDTGVIPWSATASSGSTKGTAATLGVRPTAAIPANTNAAINIEYSTAT